MAANLDFLNDIINPPQGGGGEAVPLQMPERSVDPISTRSKILAIIGDALRSAGASFTGRPQPQTTFAEQLLQRQGADADRRFRRDVAEFEIGRQDRRRKEDLDREDEAEKRRQQERQEDIDRKNKEALDAIKRGEAANIEAIMGELGQFPEAAGMRFDLTTPEGRGSARAAANFYAHKRDLEDKKSTFTRQDKQRLDDFTDDFLDNIEQMEGQLGDIGEVEDPQSMRANFYRRISRRLAQDPERIRFLTQEFENVIGAAIDAEIERRANVPPPSPGPPTFPGFGPGIPVPSQGVLDSLGNAGNVLLDTLGLIGTGEQPQLTPEQLRAGKLGPLSR